MFAPEQIPVKAELARSFGVFNRLFTAVPGPSSPNHLFTQSATSCGMRDNKLYDDCGGANKTFPQMTIFDSLRLHNVSFGFFMVRGGVASSLPRRGCGAGRVECGRPPQAHAR
eukprot:825681-Prymnesium_polylepis.1